MERNSFQRIVSKSESLRSLLRLISALLAASLCLAGGCGGRPEEMEGKANSGKPSQVASETPQGGQTFTVGISLRDQKAAFDRAMQSAMETTGKTKKLTLQIESAEANRERQLQQVEGFVSQRVSAILLCPADAVVADAAVREANNAHIPVFTADTAATRGTVVSHIAIAAPAAGKPAETPLDSPTKGAKLGKTALETVAAYLRGEKVKPLTPIAVGLAKGQTPQDAKHSLP